MSTAKRERYDNAHYRGWHLANTPHEGLTTEFEWGVMRFAEAFERWVVQLGAITGMSEISFSEIVILHVIGMQDRPKSAAAIARQLNRDDIPNIQYGIRKLVKNGFCRSIAEKTGKVQEYELTPAGRKAGDHYARLREEILTSQTMGIDRIDERLRDAVSLVSLLTGIYDEAARISATYSGVDDD